MDGWSPVDHAADRGRNVLLCVIDTKDVIIHEIIITF